MTTVGVAIPHIPIRAEWLGRAVMSVACQSRPADAISIATDIEHAGAAITRNRAWRTLDTDYVLCLDDDDELLPECLAILLARAEVDDADLTFPYYTVVGGTDPFPGNFGRPWDGPRQTTIVCLWRRDALEKVGGFPEPGDDYDDTGNRTGEDFLAVKRLHDAGGRIVHVPERLFLWHHHHRNTSGRGDRW